MKANIVREIRSMQAEIDGLERGIEVILLHLSKPGATTLVSSSNTVDLILKNIIALQKKAGVYPEQK